MAHRTPGHGRRTSTSTSSSSTSISTASTDARATEENAVRSAFLGWIDTKPRDAVGRYVEDFGEIKQAILAAASRAPLPLDQYSGRVDSVRLIDATHAVVVYDFLNRGRVVVPDLPGRAIKIDGVWKVSRATVCAALAIGGTHCPPPNH